MIRFSCPGCGATYSVDDSKAGKTGRCPKCQSQFQIPASEEADASPAGGSHPGPSLPPPPPVDPNAPVEIAPCPSCDARLSVAAADVGADVECPYCKTVYQARKSSAVAPPNRSDLEDVGRSRRSVEEDEEDDRPSRRRRRDEEEDDDRPGPRRSRYDEEEDDYDRPRRRRRRPAPQSGMVSTVGVFNYILGGLCFLCTCLFVGVGAMIGDLMKKGKIPKNQQDIDPDVMAVILYGLGGCNLLFAIVLIVAGIGVSQRKKYGRILTFVCSGLAILYTMYLIFNTFTLVGGGGGGNPAGLCFSVLLTLLFGAYGVFALIAMAKNGDEFT